MKRTVSQIFVAIVCALLGFLLTYQFKQLNIANRKNIDYNSSDILLELENLKKENDNTVVLIMNNSYSRNWQTPEKVRKYIIDNWTKRGEIEKFDIYEKEK